MTGRTRTFHRRAYRVRHLLVGCVAAALAVSGCSADADPSGDGDKTSGGKASDSASDGEKIEVADSAVTAVKDAAGETMASYAIILENPSADIAVATKLEIRLLDKSGEPVEDLVVERDVVSKSANLIMPGKQQAVTNATYTDGKVDSIEVTASGTSWFAGDDERFAAVTATDITVTAPDDANPTVEFTVDSPYEKELSTVATYAVLRDADGKLVGGSAPNDAKPRAYEPGGNDGEIELSGGLPPKWDPDSTEVHIDPLIGT